MNDTISVVFCGILLAGVIVLFVRICVKLRRGGGSMTTTVLGATDAFLSLDRRKAAETIVNRNAGKTFEDQGSDEEK